LFAGSRKVQDLIGTLSVEFDRWKEWLETSNTASNKEFAPLTQSLKVQLKKVKIDVNDLSQTIQIVSANRNRFKDIDDKVEPPSAHGKGRGQGIGAKETGGWGVGVVVGGFEKEEEADIMPDT
jgi:hypothetical protein